mgnify:CR=1 FL=1
MPNPRTATEWAEKCSQENHGLVPGQPSPVAFGTRLCLLCADAYARQRVREALEEAKKVLLSKPMGRQALWVAHDAVNAIAALREGRDGN